MIIKSNQAAVDHFGDPGDEGGGEGIDFEGHNINDSVSLTTLSYKSPKSESYWRLIT